MLPTGTLFLVLNRLKKIVTSNLVNEGMPPQGIFETLNNLFIGVKGSYKLKCWLIQGILWTDFESFTQQLLLKIKILESVFKNPVVLKSTRKKEVLLKKNLKPERVPPPLTQLQKVVKGLDSNSSVKLNYYLKTKDACERLVSN